MGGDGVPSTVGVELSARSLRRALRRMRRASPVARPLGETLQDLYVVAFAIALVAAMVAPLAGDTLRDISARSGSGHAPPGLAAMLGLTLVLALAGSGLRALVLLGPVVRDPADATWLLAAPVDRRGLLLPTAGVVASGCAAGGALIGLAAAELGAAPWWGGAFGGALLGVVVCAVAVSGQGHRRTAVLRRLADGVTASAAVALVLALAGAAPSWRQRAHPAVVAGALTGVLAVAAAVGAAAIRRSLGRLRRSDLVAGAGLALGLRATVTALDGSFAAETLRVRRVLERGVVRSRRLWGTGAAALVAADVRRTLRWPRGVVVALCAAPVAWAADDLYGRLAAAATIALVAWWAAGAGAAGLRTVSRTPALARSLPFSDSTLRAAHCVVPATCALVVAAVASGLDRQPWWWAPVAALVAVAGALRSAAGRSAARWDMQAVSPMGALPVGAVTSYLVGVDVVLLSSLPWLAGAGLFWSALLPAVAVSILLRWNRRPA